MHAPCNVEQLRFLFLNLLRLKDKMTTCKGHSVSVPPCPRVRLYPSVPMLTRDHWGTQAIAARWVPGLRSVCRHRL